MLQRIRTTYREQGLAGLALAARKLVAPPRARALPLALDMVGGRSGLEIGGPSGVFSGRGILPLYAAVAALDNCNFASLTRWEGAILEGRNYRFSPGKQPGRQYVAESTDLAAIDSDRYEFLISSHVLEHCANPIQALAEWKRVVAPGGPLVLLIPHRDGTFDHRRPITTLAHLVEDYESGVKEDDQTHVPEILELHDLARDPGAGSREDFASRCTENVSNRCLHHHVFDSHLAATLLDHVGLELLSLEAMRPNHIVAVVRKPEPNVAPDNTAFLGRLDQVLSGSPFATDRMPGAA